MSTSTSILDRIASALGRKNEVPNQELARQLAESYNSDAVKVLVKILGNQSWAIWIRPAGASGSRK